VFLEEFCAIDELVVLMLMTFGADDEAGLAEIEVFALATVVASVADGGDLADVALVVVEDVLLGVAVEAALRDHLVAGGGEGVGHDCRLKLLLLLGKSHLSGQFDGGLHVDVHH
jgi:hypothetical protein